MVTEKELGLRQALKTMGMTDAAFWLSWMGCVGFWGWGPLRAGWQEVCLFLRRGGLSP